jgi:dTDP-4-dehydrorhamnose reductase
MRSVSRASHQGAIKARRRWFPSCSFIHQTAEVLWSLRLAQNGLYQVNHNKGDSFHAIVSRLRENLNMNHWELVADDSYAHQQIMLDPRLRLPLLFN